MRIRFTTVLRFILFAGMLATFPASAESPSKSTASQSGKDPLQSIWQPEFGVEWSYAPRDWRPCPDTRKKRRFPVDPNRFSQTIFVHRTAPVYLTISFERVEAAQDSDPVTLAKILRFNREAHAQFRLVSETSRKIAGVDGSLSEYVELRQGELMRVRHWITHYNGVVCQLQLLVPYDHPELLEIGGPDGFPLSLRFLDAIRNRTVLNDADVPRDYVSKYGYRINLAAGDWVPEVYDPYIPAAEHLMCTRNQGGIAVVPLSTLGQEVDRTALIEAMLWVAELPAKKLKPRPVHEGNLEGIAFEYVWGDEEETIRIRGKVLCSTTHAYLTLAWINTNSPLPADVLEQWLAQVTFTDTATAWPPGTKALTGFREKDRHAMGFWSIGQYYFDHKQFDRSAKCSQTALDCRFIQPILSTYTEAELQGGHPEAIVSYIKSCPPIVQRSGWVAMELAWAESRCGDANSAAAHYTQCIASGGYAAGRFPPNNFEDYIQCLMKADRRQWAVQRLNERIADDPSLRWTKLLTDLKQTAPATNAVPAQPATVQAPVPAPTPTGPPELKSIMWIPSKPSAQLDKTFAFEGDNVRGYKVTKIHQDTVELLTREGETLKLALKPH